MRRSCRLSASALALAVGPSLALAQMPLFLDGTAMGGSRVFSEGLNPLGNCARFDKAQPQPAFYATIIDGDQQSKGHRDVLDDMGVGGAPVPVTADHLDRLSDAPWALRGRSFGVAYIARTGNTSFTHETFRSTLAHMAGANTFVDVRHSTVDRAAVGIGSTEQGTGLGFGLRLERWRVGDRRQYVTPGAGEVALSGGPDPFSFDRLSDSALTVALDAGFIYELASGLRIGGTLDRLNQKHLWDVYERPQLRVGIQSDLGTKAQVSFEMDVNKAERMPFPVAQRTVSVSLRVQPTPDWTLLFGVERKQVGDVAVLRGGATVMVRTRALTVGMGLQVGEDRPLKGLTMAVN